MSARCLLLGQLLSRKVRQSLFPDTSTTTLEGQHSTLALTTMRAVIAPASSPVRLLAPRARPLGCSRHPVRVAASFSFEGSATSETNEATAKHGGGHAGTSSPMVRLTERGIHGTGDEPLPHPADHRARIQGGPRRRCSPSPARYPRPRLYFLREGGRRTTLLPRLRRASHGTLALVGDRPALLGSAGYHRSRDIAGSVRSRRVRSVCSCSVCPSKKLTFWSLYAPQCRKTCSAERRTALSSHPLRHRIGSRRRYRPRPVQVPPGVSRAASHGSRSVPAPAG